MFEFYKYFYAALRLRTPYKDQKYIPEVEKPNKCVHLSSCPFEQLTSHLFRRKLSMKFKGVRPNS